MSTSTKKTLCLADYDAVGFDIDHTLGIYHKQALFELFNKCLAEYMVENKGYSRKHLMLPFDNDFCALRGIIYDIKKGNFMKVSSDGAIVHCSHGTKVMSGDEVKECYPQGHWGHYKEMMNTVDNLGEEFRIFENFFDTPIMMVCARLVDQMDEEAGGLAEVYNFYADVKEGVKWLYCEYPKSSFLSEWQSNTEKYLYTCQDSVIQWLNRLKQTNKVTFALSSSVPGFATATMEFILGKDWRKYFDIVIMDSGKPAFFKHEKAFLNEQKEEVEVLNTTETFTKGNCEVLMKGITKLSGYQDPRVVYFGDSLRSDMFPVKQSWDTVMVLEEVELEQHGKAWSSGDEAWIGGSMGTQQHGQVSRINAESGRDKSTHPESNPGDEPMVKRVKQTTEPPSESDKHYLTSNRWGSYFTTRSKGSDGDQPISLDTLWSHVMCQSADVAIPHLRYIAELPMDHKFDTFNREISCKGFYPKKPEIFQN